MSLIKRNSGLYDPWKDFFDTESFFPSLRNSARSNMPAVNVSEDDKNYYVDVISPGFKKDDFYVNVDDDMLTISAESSSESSEEDKDKQYSRREYSYNSFTRSFQLPDNAKDDAITAAYTDGVLKLNIPKTTQQTKATKEIKVD